MPITQEQVNDALRRLLSVPVDHPLHLSHDDALQLLREGVATGEVSVEVGETAVRLRAAVRETPLGRALVQLYERAGYPSHMAIAEAVGISGAAVSRLLSGARVGTWPTIRLIVEYLGGDPVDYRPLWEESKRTR